MSWVLNCGLCAKRVSVAMWRPGVEQRQMRRGHSKVASMNPPRCPGLGTSDPTSLLLGPLYELSTWGASSQRNKMPLLL